MRERLAEGESKLVRIVDIASKNDRHKFSDRLRPLFASFDNRDATRLDHTDRGDSDFVAAGR